MLVEHGESVVSLSFDNVTGHSQLSHEPLKKLEELSLSRPWGVLSGLGANILTLLSE